MTKTNIISNSIIFLIFIGLIAGCKDKQKPKIYNHSNAMIILDNAEESFYVLNDGGSIQLSYQMREDYPAHRVIKEISDTLETAGWKPLKEDHLNPGLFLSNVEGWSDFEDASRTLIKTVHQWMGDWEDKDGNIVRYVFRYTYSKNKDKNLSLLQIHAIYTPSSLVKFIQAELNEK
jgi:hypothetical protein